MKQKIILTTFAFGVFLALFVFGKAVQAQEEMDSPSEETDGSGIPGDSFPVIENVDLMVEGQKANSSTNNRGMRMIWVGGHGRQFNDEEYKNIAKNYSIVIFAKFHNNFSIEARDEAARKLKDLNPNIKLFPYYSGFLWFPKLYKFGKDFNFDWYLKDLQGNRIAYKTLDKEIWYVDNTNAEYRKWAVKIVKSWMDMTYNGKSLYDGIAFDSSHIFDVQSNSQTGKLKKLISRIGRQRLEKQNEGLKKLFTETKAGIGDKIVLFNGVENKEWARNNSLDLLNVSDVAMNEDFGFHNSKISTKGELMQFVNMMANSDYSEEIFLQKANHLGVALDSQGKLRLKRYTFGAFLLGYQPGRSFYKFGGDGEHTYLHETELNNDPQEINLDFGKPLHDKYAKEGEVFKRTFAKGVVYVNMENSSQKITLSSKLILMNGGRIGKTYEKGEKYTIPAKDAAFFFNPSLEAATCSDATPYWQCSKNKPLLCGHGELINKCSQCGCPQNQICQTDGSCKILKKTYNLQDFKNLVKDWLKTITDSPADVNLDNKVNTRDLGIIMNGWK